MPAYPLIRQVHFLFPGVTAGVLFDNRDVEKLHGNCLQKQVFIGSKIKVIGLHMYQTGTGFREFRICTNPGFQKCLGGLHLPAKLSGPLLELVCTPPLQPSMSPMLRSSPQAKFRSHCLQEGGPGHLAEELINMSELWQCSNMHLNIQFSLAAPVC